VKVCPPEPFISLLAKQLPKFKPDEVCNITFEQPVALFNSIQFFIIYVPSQQLQGHLQTQQSVDTSNYIMGKHNLKSKSNER
jgi:hypothetical protein